jgi:glycolate dehydrogenase iron-sulfur subunit
VRSRSRLPTHVAAHGPPRATVGLLTGCVQHAFFSGVNAATARVLALEGCDVVIPRGQPCCGALSAHSGRDEEARRFARGLVTAFDHSGVDFVVATAAGCGSTMKEYATLLATEPGWAARAQHLARRTRELSELLVELGPRATRHPVALRVAYHDACHLVHGQGVRDQPRQLLRTIPGLELVELGEPDLCCGSAGVYNLLQPDPAAALGERTADRVAAAAPDLLVTANPGCQMQIAAAARQRGLHLPVVATATLLDACLRNDLSGIESVLQSTLQSVRRAVRNS